MLSDDYHEVVRLLLLMVIVDSEIGRYQLLSKKISRLIYRLSLTHARTLHTRTHTIHIHAHTLLLTHTHTHTLFTYMHTHYY